MDANKLRNTLQELREQWKAHPKKRMIIEIQAKLLKFAHQSDISNNERLKEIQEIFGAEAK